MTPAASEGGRAQEVRWLEAHVARACSGQGGLVAVVGEPGIGKTHLLRTVVASAPDRTAVAWGAPTSWPGTEPFGIWSQILPALAPRPASIDHDATTARRDVGDDRWRSVVSRLVAPGEGGIEAVGGSGLARLDLFEDVRALLGDAASTGPVLIVVDDLHLVHPSALDVLSYLVPSLTSMPIAVVVATRSPPPSADSAHRDQIRGLLRQGDTIDMSSLTSEATAELVASAGGPEPGSELSEDIHRYSGGNPLFALELTRLVAGRDHVHLRSVFEDRGVPETVAVVVVERIRSLSDDARRVLDIAAVLGTELRGSDLGAVIDHVEPGLALEPALVELAEGALVEPASHGFRFTHGVLREVVHGEIAADRRRRLHGAVVEAAGSAARTGGPAFPAAELAEHLLASNMPDRVERAADQLASAARSEMAVHAHVEALDHADRALALVGDAGPRGADLLVDRGSALLALGDVDDARAAFRRAADRARAADVPVVLARAALGIGSGETGFEVPLLDLEQIDLLREALDRLPPSATAWRARLLARLSVALTATDDVTRADVSEEAVRLGRASGDPATVAATLAAHCDALAGPDHTAAREEWSTDVIDLARTCSDPGLQLLGLRLRLVSRLEQGDVIGALGDADDFSAIADRLGQPTFRWYPHLWRAMRLLLAGQSTAAFDAAAAAEEGGRRAHSPNAELLVLTHRWMHWVQIGDTESMRRLIESFDDGDAMPRATWAWVSLAFAFAHLGRLNAARLRLDAVADELRSAPRDSEWVPMLTQVAEAVHLCGSHPVGGWAYDALLPYRDQHVVEGIGAVMAGSIERPLGLLAAASGDLHAAATHFDAAIAANRLLGSPALVATTFDQAGVALGDPDRLARARELYEELGWKQCIARLDREPAGRPDRTSAERERDRGRMVRDGDGWELGFWGVTVHVRDSKGLHDLAVLLGRPHVEVAALDLASTPAGDAGSRSGRRGSSEAPGGSEGSLGPVLDRQARAAYQARILELDGEIDDARSIADAARLEAAQDERDLLVSELASAYGLGGAPRRPGDPAERARTTVTSRIRYAIDRIEQAHPDLGRHLRNAVVTGRFCCYRPENPVVWEM